MVDIFGQALKDYYEEKEEKLLWLHNSYGDPEEMPIDIFFRMEEDMSPIELKALKLCKGKILDIGAGVGCHSIVLQERGLDVTALEISKDACEIMQDLGIKQIENADILTFKPIQKFDSLLLLMNGIGLSRTYSALPDFLEILKRLKTSEGVIVFDSSDISYLYNGTEKKSSKQNGEVSYSYQYGNTKDPWFDWVYISPKQMEQFANEAGLTFKLIMKDQYDQYLATLK